MSGPRTRSSRGADYQRVARPVAALATEFPANHLDPRHSHERAQLLYASAGVMVVDTDQASFVVPPERAVWLPAGLPHEVLCRSPVSVRTLYVDPAAHPGLSEHCKVIAVSTLLRELIIEATRIPVEYDEDGRDGRLVALLLDEISATPTEPLHIPMPQNERLTEVCRALLADPARQDTLDDWAEMARMGRRTFTRLFRRETGMTFAAWRQHVRLMEALSRLAVGQRITKVAFDIGYNSSSAFTAMFNRTFGTSPAKYFQS